MSEGKFSIFRKNREIVLIFDRKLQNLLTNILSQVYNIKVGFVFNKEYI